MAYEVTSNRMDETELLERRKFLARLSVVLGGLAALMVGVPVIGFIFTPLIRKVPQIWRSVGAADDFAIGATSEVSFLDSSPLPWAGVTAKTAAWVRRETKDSFTAYSVNCTHLGCPVRWLADADLFMCPCHGGVYYKDGRVAAGPPPKPLPRYPVRLRDGQVEILTSPIPMP